MFYGILTIILISGQTFLSSINPATKTSAITIKNSGSLTINTPISAYKGTLAIDVPATGSVTTSGGSNLLTFAGGVLSTGQNSYTLTGTYDVSGADTALLGAGDLLDIASGAITQSIVAKGTVGSPSVLRGQGTFAQAITVFDASSALSISLQNTLAQNIALNSGTVVLGSDLTFANGYFFTGNGTVNVNGFKLNLPINQTTAWSNTLTFQNAKTINLFGYTKLTGTWNFSDPAGVSELNGNGAVLDLTGGGVLQVASNHTLYIADLHIKGLGAANGLFNLNTVNGTVRLSNVTLELMADYTHSSGQIYVFGDNCRLVYQKTAVAPYYFNVTSTGTFTVDHQAFEYEPAGSAWKYPFTFTNQGTQLNIINNGSIRLAGGAGTGALVFDPADTSPTTEPAKTLLKNVFLTASSPLNITNVGATVTSIAIDGKGYYIQFPTVGSNYLTTGNTLTVNFTDTIFKDYNPSVITNGTSSVINFGSGCVVQLSKDLTLNGGATALTFNGNSTLDARGRTISISAAGKIAVSGGSTLTIKNANINITHATAITCAVAADKVVFSNCNIFLGASGLTWATGNIDVDGVVSFYGANESTPQGISTITYSSGGALQVLTDSVLKLLTNINFVYQANPTVNSDTFVQSKRHFKLLDPSSTLVLSGATITTTTTGMALDYGNFVIEDASTLTINAGAGAQFDLGSAVNLFLRASATLIFDGPVAYNATTYP